jgi:hypothetical protein
MVSSKPIMKEHFDAKSKDGFTGIGNYTSGIEKMVDLKKAMHYAKKVSMISDGIELAELKK